MIVGTIVIYVYLHLKLLNDCVLCVLRVFRFKLSISTLDPWKLSIFLLIMISINYLEV